MLQRNSGVRQWSIIFFSSDQVSSALFAVTPSSLFCTTPPAFGYRVDTALGHTTQICHGSLFTESGDTLLLCGWWRWVVHNYVKRVVMVVMMVTRRYR